jgi:hypothetical protein
MVRTSHNISIESPYNSRIKQILHEMEEKHMRNEPTIIFGGGAPREYIRSGNNGHYPEVSLLEDMRETGGGHHTLKRVVKRVARVARAVAPIIERELRPRRKRSVVDPRMAVDGPVSAEPMELDLPMPPRRKIGGKVNRVKKFKKWTKAIGDFLKPVAKPITQAFTKKAVEKISGMGKFYDRIPSHTRTRGRSTHKVSSHSRGISTHRRSISRGRSKSRGKSMTRRSPSDSPERAKPRVMVKSRSARTAIVKQVMKQHGLSMIEASKYVKSHGLY